MDAGKMEIFGMNLNELKMVKGSLEVKIRINKNHDKEDLGKWKPTKWKSCYEKIALSKNHAKWKSHRAKIMLSQNCTKW